MVSIATWNVENLFTPNADSGPDGAAEFAAKADALAATITAMDPDVLALQEIGDPEALDDVLGRVGGTWHVETADPDGRGIRVAIAARTPLSQVYQVGPFLDGLRPVQIDDTAVGETAMGRPALHAVVDGMHVLTCHLKSKLLTFPGGRFSPRDEDERARFATYALFRRQRRRRRSARPPQRSSPPMVTHRWSCWVISMTRSMLRPPSCWRGRPDLRSAPVGTPNLTVAIVNACGTSPPASPRINGSPVFTAAAVN